MSTSARTSSSVGAEVDEARPQADLAVDRRRRDPDARRRPGACARAARWRRSGRSRRRGAGTGRSRAAAGRRAARAGRARARARRAAAPGAGSPRPRRGTPRAPWARNASQSLSARNGREYSSVMSTMWPVRSCGMYASSCANAWIEVVAAADEQHATRLRQVEPLVRVERDRVGAVEAGEEMAGRRRRRGGQPVGAVDVEPDARLGTHVGERADRIDGARQRRARPSRRRRRARGRRRDRPGSRRAPPRAAAAGRRRSAATARSPSRSRGARPRARSSSAPRSEQ